MAKSESTNANGPAPKAGAVPASNPYQELTKQIIAEKFPQGAGIRASGIVTAVKSESFVSHKGDTPVTWESQKLTVTDGQNTFTMNQMRNVTENQPPIEDVPQGSCIMVEVTSTKTEKGAAPEVRGTLHYV